MVFCANCGNKIKEETKFCANCGSPTTTNNVKTNIKNNDDINLVEDSLNQPNKNKRLFIALLAIFIVAIIFFIGKSFIPNNEISEPLFDIDEEVQKIEGNWVDPSGVILKDKTEIIYFKSVGSISKGTDNTNTIEISMIPINKNRYYGTVILNGIEGEFDVTYYNEENKLVFFNKLTKSSWYLIKLNN